MPLEGENDDIRGDLLAAVTSIETANPGSTGNMASVAAERAAPKGAAESPVTVASDSTAVAPTGETKDRDEKGKFVPKVETKSVEPKGSAKETTEKPLEEAKPGAEGDKPDAAPGSLPGILKQKWAALDPDAKNYIRTMETKLATQAGTLGDQLKQAKTRLDEFEPVLGPRRHALIANYGSEGKALAHLFNLSDFASKDPPGFISWLAQQTGTDLTTLASGGQQQQAQPAAQLPAEFLQEFNGLKGQFNSLLQKQQQEAQNSVANEIGAVALEKDAQGNFVRPYFEDLRPQIGPLLAVIRKEHPEMSPREIAVEAYDRAVWANKDTRAQLMQATAGKRVEDEAAQARAEAAKRAGKSTFGDPPNRFNAPAAESGSVRDDIAKAVYASMGGGARL